MTSLRDWGTTDEAAGRHTRSWAKAEFWAAAVRQMTPEADA